MKKVLSILLSCALSFSICAPAFAASPSEEAKAADALNVLGIFRGYGNDYGLDDPLYRDQGVALLVRLLGAEEEANSGKYKHNFTDDIPAWADGVVAYASTKGLIVGIGNNTFWNGQLEKKQTLTMALRTLGYTSNANGGDFTYDGVVAFAKSVGIDTSAFGTTSFDRGDAVRIFWQAVNAKMKGSDETLGENLVKQGVITEKQLSDAKAAYSSSTAGNTSDTSGNSTGSNTGSTSGSTTGNGSSSENKDEKQITFEEFNAMSAEEQLNFFNSFSNQDAFWEWFKKAKAEYDEKNKPIEIENGEIDLGKLIDGNG